MSRPDVDRLLAALWPNGDHLAGEQVHMLLDGARDPAIAPLVRFGKLEFDCLFGGRLTPRLRAAAPYLVHLHPDSPQTRELLARGWDQHWGVLTVARPDVTISQQRLHFKKYLRVRDDSGTQLAFRFYDPRVLRTYLDHATSGQRRRFLGPVSRLLLPDGDGVRLLEYSAREGALVRDLAAGRVGAHRPHGCAVPQADDEEADIGMSGPPRIRAAQMRAFQRERDDEFVRRLAARARLDEPRLVADLSEPQLLRRLGDCVARALGFGLRDPFAIMEFFAASLLLDARFDETASVRAVLGPADAQVDHRVHRLWQLAPAAVRAEAAALAPPTHPHGGGA